MPIPLFAIAAAQAGLGLIQKGISANERRNAERNFTRYQIPAGIKAMMNVMQGLSTQTEMPGSDLLRSRQGAMTAQGVETAQRTSETGGDALGLLSELYGRQLDSAENMAIQNAQYYEQNRLRYANALQTLGGYQTEKWKYNELYPYMQKMTAAGQTDAAGGQNISSGIGSMIDIAGGNENMAFQQKMFDEWRNNIYGANLGEPFNRTRLQDSTLRNLPQPDIYSNGIFNPTNPDYRTQLNN